MDRDDLAAQLLVFLGAIERLSPKILEKLSDPQMKQNQSIFMNPMKRKRDEDEDSADDDSVDDADSSEAVSTSSKVDESVVESDSVHAMEIVAVSGGVAKGVSTNISPEDWAKLSFEERLNHLVIYKNKFGHCKVPQLFKENPSMGLWVRDLRVKKRKGKLTQEVEAKLTDIGFVWNCRQRKKAKISSKRLPWKHRFQQLKEFFEKNGHCNVPSNYKNKQLYHWVTNQRRDYRCGVMTDSRIQKLKSIGFEWNSQRKKNKNDEDLVIL
jgi:hypothetical protein